MKIDRLLCDEETELHIRTRHNVGVHEVEEAAYRSYLVLRGRSAGIYEVYGRTEAGRYLMIAVRNLGKGVARVITARDMTNTERRRYQRYSAH